MHHRRVRRQEPAQRHVGSSRHAVCSEVIAATLPCTTSLMRRVDQFPLTQGRPLDRPVYALDVLLMPDVFGVLAPEQSDPATSV